MTLLLLIDTEWFDIIGESSSHWSPAAQAACCVSTGRRMDGYWFSGGTDDNEEEELSASRTRTQQETERRWRRRRKQKRRGRCWDNRKQGKATGEERRQGVETRKETWRGKEETKEEQIPAALGGWCLSNILASADVEFTARFDLLCLLVAKRKNVADFISVQMKSNIAFRATVGRKNNNKKPQTISD